MIGDHYKDETEAYKETLPVQVCRLEFTCKRCGETFSDISVPVRGYITDTTLMNNALARNQKDDPYYPENVDTVKSHLCNDGGLGVAEYTGLHYNEAK
jgi:hypothetical protein